MDQGDPPTVLLCLHHCTTLYSQPCCVVAIPPNTYNSCLLVHRRVHGQMPHGSDCVSAHAGSKESSGASGRLFIRHWCWRAAAAGRRTHAHIGPWRLAGVSCVQRNVLAAVRWAQHDFNLTFPTVVTISTGLHTHSTLRPRLHAIFLT